jgi:hypothetical protein
MKFIKFSKWLEAKGSWAYPTQPHWSKLKTRANEPSYHDDSGRNVGHAGPLVGDWKAVALQEAREESIKKFGLTDVNEFVGKRFWVDGYGICTVVRATDKDIRFEVEGLGKVKGKDKIDLGRARKTWSWGKFRYKQARPLNASDVAIDHPVREPPTTKSTYDDLDKKSWKDDYEFDADGYKIRKPKTVSTQADMSSIRAKPEQRDTKLPKS